MITVEGNAKINLTLDILGKRPDGYHEVAMVMQSIGLHDTLTLSKISSGIELTLDVPGLEADERNLAWRAARLLLDGEGVKGGVRIALTKRIPIAAGLAGGSADAAAVLRGVNALYELGLTQAELCAYGAKLGSDIPFTIVGGTMLATGRGEVLEALDPVPPFWVVLAKPKISVSTAWAYKHYDEQGAEQHLAHGQPPAGGGRKVPLHMRLLLPEDSFLGLRFPVRMRPLIRKAVNSMPSPRHSRA